MKGMIEAVNEQDIFASAQIITLNPILKEPAQIQMQYFLYLQKLVHFANWDRRRYTKAQLDFYASELCHGETVTEGSYNNDFDERFCYLIPFDISAMLGFKVKLISGNKTRRIVEKIAREFGLKGEKVAFLRRAFSAATGDSEAWEQVLNSKMTRGFKRYLNHVRKNISFIQTKPFRILVTATMSAGKSTLINALVGKNISRMQNMACTGKIHTIISKPFEDDAISEYDHDLIMSASQDELLNDDSDNETEKIVVGSYFHGELEGKRLTLLDSPGVNFSENDKHAKISQRAIQSKKYDLLLYILNSTNLTSTDEERHLENVRKWIGRKKLIFIMNKADQLVSEDDDYQEEIESQRQFLIAKRFKNPIICPVSSRAAYLAKKSQQTVLSRWERREMENLLDKFEQEKLARYYTQQLGCSRIMPQSDEDTLLANCGFAYLERIIASMSNGGDSNDTGVC